MEVRNCLCGSILFQAIGSQYSGRQSRQFRSHLHCLGISLIFRHCLRLTGKIFSGNLCLRLSQRFDQLLHGGCINRKITLQKLYVHFCRHAKANLFQLFSCCQILCRGIPLCIREPVLQHFICFFINRILSAQVRIHRGFSLRNCRCCCLRKSVLRDRIGNTVQFHKLLQRIRSQRKSCTYQPLCLLSVLIVYRQSRIRNYLVHLLLQFLRNVIILYFRTAVLCHIEVPDLRFQSIIHQVADRTFFRFLQGSCHIPGAFQFIYIFLCQRKIRGTELLFDASG